MTTVYQQVNTSFSPIKNINKVKHEFYLNNISHVCNSFNDLFLALQKVGFINMNNAILEWD